MRTFVVFFLCFCCTLLKGYEPVFAGRQHVWTENSTVQSQKSWQAEVAGKGQQPKKVMNYVYSEKKEDLINAEDDEDVISLRKYIQITRCFIILGYASVLVCLMDSLKKQLPFCSHFSYTSSYKYILQRTLRL